MKKRLLILFLIALSFFWLSRTAAPVKGSIDPNARVSAKVATLDRVLKDQRDNDPRIDGELSKLNQKERLDFRAKYRSLKRESLRGRGLIVYLLGRNIETQGDLDFLKEVLDERNCLSLKNCAITDQETLSAPAMATRLAFPKLMAIAALKEKLRSRQSPKMHMAIEDVLRDARNSINPLIAKAAN